MTSTASRHRAAASAPSAPVASPAEAPAAPARPRGRLDWHQLLQWLVEDGMVSDDESKRLGRRFGGGASSLHALVRLGGAGLQHDGRPLDCEVLTEWLARRVKLPYLRIDPLKVDVGRVAEVMSLQYAEMRKVLPVGLTSSCIQRPAPVHEGVEALPKSSWEVKSPFATAT